MREMYSYADEEEREKKLLSSTGLCEKSEERSEEAFCIWRKEKEDMRRFHSGSGWIPALSSILLSCVHTLPRVKILTVLLLLS